MWIYKYKCFCNVAMFTEIINPDYDDLVVTRTRLYYALYPNYVQPWGWGSGIVNLLAHCDVMTDIRYIRRFGRQEAFKDSALGRMLTEDVIDHIFHYVWLGSLEN